MGDTGFSSFNTTVEKTNKILKEIEQAYGLSTERRNISYAALRSVLHALRDRLTVQETAHFAAQLPMLVRGIYYHSWDPSEVPVKMHRDEFLQRVQQEFPFDAAGGIERLVTTVLHALRRYVAAGEWEIIKANMPKDIVPLLQAAMEPDVSGGAVRVGVGMSDRARDKFTLASELSLRGRCVARPQALPRQFR